MTTALPAPAHWHSGQMKHVARVSLGKMLQSSNSGSDLVAPYLRAANVQPDGVLRLEDRKTMFFGEEELAALDVRAGDVVVVEGGIGGFGRAAYVRHDLDGWGFQNSINRLRPLDGVDGRFLAYYLLAQRARGFIAAFCNIVSMPHLTAEKLASMPVSIPPAGEQRLIADHLDRETERIDELAAKQLRLISNLRERRAAAAAASIETSLLASDGRRFKHYVAAVRQGWSPQCYPWPADDDDESWAVLKVGCVNGGRFRAEENKALPTTEIPRIDAVVQIDDLVVSRANTRELLGSAAVVHGSHPRLMLSDKLYAFTLDPTVATPDYVALVLATSRSRGLIELAASGASPSMQNISQGDLLGLPMSLPAVDEQRDVVALTAARTARIDLLIEKAERFIDVARERRAALITAAVTGQIDVRDVA